MAAVGVAVYRNNTEDGHEVNGGQRLNQPAVPLLKHCETIVVFTLRDVV